MKTESNILFPTDFTDISEHALNFAATHVKKAKGKLVILSIVDMPFTNVTEEEKSEIDLLLNDLINHSNYKLNKLKLKYEKEFGISIQVETFAGESIKAIQRAVSNFGINLIIMGTKANKDLFFKFSSFNIVKNASVPLITVSIDSPISNLKTLLFPFNENILTLKKADHTLQFAKLYNLRVVFLGISVANTTEKISNITNEMMYVKNLFDAEGIANEVHFESSDNYTGIILDYCDRNSIDIICIANDHTNLLKSSLNVQDAKNVIKNAHIPVLTIPVWRGI